MNISRIDITLRSEGKLKGFADIVLDDCFVVKGIRIVEGARGYFISMPARKMPNGYYQDIAHPIRNEIRKSMEERILSAYRTKYDGHIEHHVAMR
jgi:stage V sporulation protein G